MNNMFSPEKLQTAVDILKHDIPGAVLETQRTGTQSSTAVSTELCTFRKFQIFKRHGNAIRHIIGI